MQRSAVFQSSGGGRVKTVLPKSLIIPESIEIGSAVARPRSGQFQHPQSSVTKPCRKTARSPATGYSARHARLEWGNGPANWDSIKVGVSLVTLNRNFAQSNWCRVENWDRATKVEGNSIVLAYISIIEFHRQQTAAAALRHFWSPDHNFQMIICNWVAIYNSLFSSTSWNAKISVVFPSLSHIPNLDTLTDIFSILLSSNLCRYSQKWMMKIITHCLSQK